MADKIDGKTVVKYLAMAGGAILVPVVLTQFVGAQLAQIPFWGYAIWQGITVGAVASAAVGIGAVEQLLFSK